MRSRRRTTATRCSTSSRTATSRRSPTLMVSQQFERVVTARRRGRDPARRHAGCRTACTQRGGRDLRPADRARRLAARCAIAPGSTWPRSATSAAICPRPRNRSPRSSDKLPPQLEEERGLLLAQLLMAARRLRRRRRPADAICRRRAPARATFATTSASRCSASGESTRGTQLLDELGKESRADRGVPEPARPGQRRPRLLGARGDIGPKDARAVPRARAPAEPAGEQGAARLRLGRRRAGGPAVRARAVAWSSRSATSATPRCSRRSIAIPYAYAELGAYGQALQRYEAAIAAYERENADAQRDRSRRSATAR